MGAKVLPCAVTDFRRKAVNDQAPHVMCGVFFYEAHNGSHRVCLQQILRQ